MNISKKTLSERLEKERKITRPGKDPYRTPHLMLAEKIGISAFTLQRLINGAEPKQMRIKQLIASYFAGKR